MIRLCLMFLVCSTGLDDCLEFLLARSPGADASEPNLGVMVRNTELAIQARDMMPWGSEIPDSVFLRYVLPARVSQEPLTLWRPVFMEHVMPLVEGVTDLQEAVLIISSWSDSITRYMPTQLRDQSPLVTWSSGIGRCEELTVFFMCALRSVGIPCRQAYTPWWLTVDGNHAWPEVWTGDGWKCLERVSTENRQPEENWFTERARSAALILAVVPDSVPGAIQFSAGASFLPVTSSYTETGLLVIADDSTQVWVNIANHGAIRRLAKVTSPIREIELGEGVYVLTWGWPVQTMLIEVVPGDTVIVLPGRGGQLPQEMHLNTRRFE